MDRNSFILRHTQFCQYHLLNSQTVLSPVCILDTFVKISCLYIGGLTSGFSFLGFPSVCVLVCMLVPCCFGYYIFVVYFKNQNYYAPIFFMLLEIDLTIQCLLWFHMNFSLFFYYMKKVIGILQGNTLNLCIFQ
jgi:hypothetical protein